MSDWSFITTLVSGLARTTFAYWLFYSVPILFLVLVPTLYCYVKVEDENDDVKLKAIMTGWLLGPVAALIYAIKYRSTKDND
jgi:heme/copper-type cytochrome/quinol oxidase subunit 2